MSDLVKIRHFNLLAIAVVMLVAIAVVIGLGAIPAADRLLDAANLFNF